MRFWIILSFIFAVISGGCLLESSEKVPVLHVNVTMSEDANGTMLIKGIEAQAGEMKKLDAPGEQLAEKFPAVYVNVVQNMTLLAYMTGKDYNGPGVYSYTLGLQSKVNMTRPAGITVEAINKNQQTDDLQGMYFNWSTEMQSITFK